MYKNTIHNRYVIMAVSVFLATAFCEPVLAVGGVCCSLKEPQCVEATGSCETCCPCPPFYGCNDAYEECAGFNICCEYWGGCKWINAACCEFWGEPSNCCTAIRGQGVDEDEEAESGPLDEECHTQALHQVDNLWLAGLASILMVSVVPIMRRRRRE